MDDLDAVIQGPQRIEPPLPDLVDADVVVEDHDRAASRYFQFGYEPNRRRGLGQPDRHDSTFAGLGSDVQAAAPCLNSDSGMVKAQAGPAGLPVGFPPLAQARQGLGGDALPVVLDSEQYVVVLAGQADRDRPFRVQSLDAVVDQVRQDPLELRGLDFGEEAVGRRVEPSVISTPAFAPN